MLSSSCSNPFAINILAVSKKNWIVSGMFGVA
jgi:hypothetical protein